MGTVAAAVVAFVGASEADSASLVALNNVLKNFISQFQGTYGSSLVACFAFPFDFAVAAAEADCTVVAVVVVAAVVDSSYFAAVVADLMSF